MRGEKIRRNSGKQGKILARGKLQHNNSLYYIEKKVAARNISFC
jgi:hypothetical protein